MRKIQIGILIVVLALGGIMINNGIFSRDATITEAKVWAQNHIKEDSYSGSFTGEPDIFYNRQGQAIEAQEIISYSYTTKITGRAALWADEGAGFGNYWCFELSIEPTDVIGAFKSECWRITINKVTGKVMDNGFPVMAPKQGLIFK